MSVWTRVKSKVLESNVDIEMFTESIKELGLELDFSVKQISNAYGKENVDAMIKNKGKKTALGIVHNTKGGIDLVGDTWQSGITGDKQHNKVANMLSQAYQVYKTKKQLELNGWNVMSKKVEEKIVLTCEQW